MRTSPFPVPFTVSRHAQLRYAQRILGLTIDETTLFATAELARRCHRNVMKAALFGRRRDEKIIHGCISLRVVGPVVVTVLLDEPRVRAARSREDEPLVLVAGGRVRKFREEPARAPRRARREVA